MVRVLKSITDAPLAKYNKMVDGHEHVVSMLSELSRRMTSLGDALAGIETALNEAEIGPNKEQLDSAIAQLSKVIMFNTMARFISSVEEMNQGRSKFVFGIEDIDDHTPLRKFKVMLVMMIANELTIFTRRSMNMVIGDVGKKKEPGRHVAMFQSTLTLLERCGLLYITNPKMPGGLPTKHANLRYMITDDGVAMAKRIIEFIGDPSYVMGGSIGMRPGKYHATEFAIKELSGGDHWAELRMRTLNEATENMRNVLLGVENFNHPAEKHQRYKMKAQRSNKYPYDDKYPEQEDLST